MPAQRWKKTFLGHYTFVYFKLPGFERLKSPDLLFFLSSTWLYILVLVYFLSTKLLAIFNTVIFSSTWLNSFNRITVSFKHLLAPSSSTYCNHLYFKTIMVLLPCSTPNKYFHQWLCCKYLFLLPCFMSETFDVVII